MIGASFGPSEGHLGPRDRLTTLHQSALDLHGPCVEQPEGASTELDVANDDVRRADHQSCPGVSAVDHCTSTADPVLVQIGVCA